jgi:hypothetical protein
MGSPVGTGQFAYVLPSLTVRIVDASGKPLHGIHVLYRIAPPPKQPENEGLTAYFSKLVYGEEKDPPPPRFELGMTDVQGYLVPLGGGPAGSGLGPVLSVEGIKLVSNIPYEMYLLRHPDAALAQSAQAELNACLGQPRAGQLIKDWPDPQTYTPSVELITTTNEDQLTISIPIEAGRFMPPGPSRYGGWTLYKGMPHASEQVIKDAVTKLQFDLGALRYVIGAEPPYEPEALNKKQTNKSSANVGDFDARTMSAVLHLQRMILAGAAGKPNAFKVTDKAAAHAKCKGATGVVASHEYLKGSAVTVAPLTPQAGERSQQADGVVDAITGRALQSWLDQGLRRLGTVLVGTKARCPKPIGHWDVWLRNEANDALEAWRTTTMALGFAEGIAANHTYRTPLQDIGEASYGRSPVSIHKTGLAIDVGVGNGFKSSTDDWPVVFVRDALVEKKDKKGVVFGHRAYWRLWARSDLPADITAATTELTTRLQALTDDPGMTSVVANKLLGELSADAAAFFASYFTDKVAQWVYDAYDDEGGAPGVAQTPAERFGDPKYTRWIDITKLGELCNLKRIGSFTNNLQPTGSDWGLAAANVTPDTIAKLSTLAKGLQSAKSEVEDPVDVTLDGKQVPLADLQADKLVAYANALPNFTKDKALKRFCVVNGSRLRVSLSWSATGKEAIEAAAVALESIEISLIAAEVDQTPRTGAGWAAWLRERVTALEQQAPAQQTNGSSSAQAKPPQRLSLLPVIAELEAGPVVVPQDKRVTYPAPGAPIGMEWWHFQRTDLVGQVKRFGSLLLELGWTEEGLLDTASAVTHWRAGVGYPMSELDKTVG